MKRLAKALVLVSAGAVCLVLLARPGTQASPDDTITVNITAEVATVDDPDLVLGGAISAGDTITGTYTYDAATPDSNPSPTVGDYWHSSAPYGIKIDAGGFVFETNPTADSFLVEMVNDTGSPASDYYLLRSYNNLPLSNGATVDHIAWQLDDPTAAALSSDALPTVPPNLEDWQSVSGLTLEGHDPSDPYATYLVRAHVTSVGEPDLVITDVWSEPPLVYYQVRNIGDAVAPEGHCAALFVDGDHQVSDCTDTPLGPGERSTSLFNYSWACAGLEDDILVWADYGDEVPESDEQNNGREEVWKCDTTPPKILLGPIVTGLTQNAASIFWTTDEASDSLVEYGEKAGVPAYQQVASALVKVHSVNLTGLQPSTTYHFVAYSADSSGNVGQSKDMIFETLPLPDSIDPEVSITDPGTLEGIATISVEAFDDIGVEKVECLLDDQLVFTDFSPGSPYACPVDSRLFSNGEHQLRVSAQDRFGRVTEATRPVTVYNFEDVTPPTVTIANLDDGDVVSGEVWVAANVHDDQGLHGAYLYVDSGPARASLDFAYSSPPYPQDKYTSFTWDTTEVPSGPHTLWVRAYDGGPFVGEDSVDVIVDNSPPPVPSLVVTGHTLTRVGAWFSVELGVRNIGDGPATNVLIEDWMRGFQPDASSGEAIPSGAGFEPWYWAKAAKMTIIDPDIGPGETQWYFYRIEPILEYPDPPTPSIGDSIRLSYSGPGQIYTRWVSSLITETTGGEGIQRAHDEAVASTDYLIVTDPVRLFDHYVSGAVGRSQVNNLLSDMAELAWAHGGGVLGYLYSYPGDRVRPDLDRLLEGPNVSDWVYKLHPEFRVGGYVLIVGETEIIPAWDTDGWDRHWNGYPTTDDVFFTDRPYADRMSCCDPDLIVGRIIGNTVSELTQAVEASIGVQRGWPGYGFDRSGEGI